MIAPLLISLTVAVAPRADIVVAQASDTAELVRLESVWNRAHVVADTAALNSLWADDLLVTVPEMPTMTKPDLMRFWQSGRSSITKYETSELRVRIYRDAAVVVGRLHRERDFSGQTVRDDWRFTKVYVRRASRWQVVAYQATPSAR
jgi:ketosteroid isomerase-like protein